jgi:hypothetical protein
MLYLMRMPRIGRDLIKNSFDCCYFTGGFVTPHRHPFTGEEVLIVCLMRLATGDPWTRLIPQNFGGDIRQWSGAFSWFCNHLFVLFYHKISGQSIEMWVGEIESFKQAILYHLAQPAYPFKREYFEEIGHPERAQYIINFPIEHWHVFLLFR